ncbi:MAG: hybrid sensor histidine kinase/response regulator [Planctomycetota bacterium]|nr:MAG: hybrid sensor histidine kinase/response regulator [Planctomycetota bacterium]
MLDIMMPGMDGFQVLERLKDHPQWCRIPVIMVTALNEREHRLRGLELGADDYLTKPVDRHELYARLKTLLRSKKLFDSLEESFEKLNQLQKQKDALVHLIVHDLKNPISGILGHLQLMGMKIGKDGQEEKLRHYQEQAEKSANYLLQLVTDILDVAQLEEGKFPLHLEHFFMDQVLDELIESLEGIMNTMNKKILFQERIHHQVYLDRHAVKRVFQNLLSNALSFTPRGKEVFLTMQKVEDRLKIRIQDQGPGIPREYHEKIFNQFERAELKKKGIHTGHGLGLAFCKLAVEAMKGRIYVDPQTELKKGSIFVVELPLELEEVKDD